MRNTEPSIYLSLYLSHSSSLLLSFSRSLSPPPSLSLTHRRSTRRRQGQSAFQQTKGTTASHQPWSFRKGHLHRGCPGHVTYPWSHSRGRTGPLAPSSPRPSIPRICWHVPWMVRGRQAHPSHGLLRRGGGTSETPTTGRYLVRAGGAPGNSPSVNDPPISPGGEQPSSWMFRPWVRPASPIVSPRKSGDMSSEGAWAFRHP